MQPPTPRFGPPGTRRRHQQSATPPAIGGGGAGSPTVGALLEEVAVSKGVELPFGKFAVDMGPDRNGHGRSRLRTGIEDLIAVSPEHASAQILTAFQMIGEVEGSEIKLPAPNREVHVAEKKCFFRQGGDVIAKQRDFHLRKAQLQITDRLVDLRGAGSLGFDHDQVWARKLQLSAVFLPTSSPRLCHPSRWLRDRSASGVSPPAPARPEK